MDYSVFTPFVRDGVGYAPAYSTRVHSSNSIRALRCALRSFGIVSSSITRMDHRSDPGFALYAVGGVLFTVRSLGRCFCHDHD